MHSPIVSISAPRQHLVAPFLVALAFIVALLSLSSNALACGVGYPCVHTAAFDVETNETPDLEPSSPSEPNVLSSPESTNRTAVVNSLSTLLRDSTNMEPQVREPQRIKEEELDPNIIDPGKPLESKAPEVYVIEDSVIVMDGQPVHLIKSAPVGKLGHTPQTATFYATIFPGLGQIYNRKYWKLPLLYGGAAALVYAIHFNNKYYKKYSSAYRDFLLMDPNNKSYMEFATKAHLTEEDVTGTYSAWFKKTLSNKKDYYRRYRDLSIFGMIGLYCVQIVDACVDAHFFNFDVSDDLSLAWAPDLSPSNGGYAGASFALNLGNKSDKQRTADRDRKRTSCGRKWLTGSDSTPNDK